MPSRRRRWASSAKLRRAGRRFHAAFEDRVENCCYASNLDHADQGDRERRSQTPSFETARTLERKAFQLQFATRDQKEGMRAFMEKRKPKLRDSDGGV